MQWWQCYILYSKEDIYEECHFLFQYREGGMQEDGVNFPALNYILTHL